MDEDGSICAAASRVDNFAISVYYKIVLIYAKWCDSFGKEGIIIKTKVCPCCDQPIHGNYCKGCRKIVWKPVEQEIHYYLNERHPANETNCSYHNDVEPGKYWPKKTVSQTASKTTPKTTSKVSDSNVRNSDHAMTVYETEAKKAEIKERMLAKQREMKSAAKTVWNGEGKRNTKSTQKSSNPAVKKIFIGLAVYLIVCFGSVIPIVFNVVRDAFDDFSFGVAIPETVMAPVEVSEAPLDVNVAPEPEPEGAADLEDWERTDEQVKAAGVACTGYGHFDVTYEDIQLEFLECMKSDGLLCTEDTTYSYNSQMDHDSWYQTVYSYTIETEEEYVGIVDLEADTATGQIHGISMYTINGDGFFKMADTIMKFLEGTGIASEDLPSGDEFYQIAMGEDGEMQRDEGVVVMFGLEVTCFVPEDLENPDFYSMSIYAPGYYTEIE